MDTDELTLAELAQAAHVSPRTVRYYISEGLLPPPEGAGPGSHYRQSHLDRLRLILRLKGAYLPLREIRRQLTGLDDDDVRRELAAGDTAGGPFRGIAEGLPFPERPSPKMSPPDSAADYLANVMRQPAPMAAAKSLRSAAPPSPPPTETSSDIQAGLPTNFEQSAQAGPSASVSAFTPPTPESPDDVDALADLSAEPWVRIRVSDDIELLVRSEAMSRLRDRVAWLVGWARSVFR